jgi:hypothetical protein
MALTMKQIVNRHGAFVSAATATCVGAVILLQKILQGVVTWFAYVPQANVGQPYWFGDVIPNAFLTALPFAVGFFLSLWLLAPIAEELRVPHVITRSVLATGIGATLLFIVQAVRSLIMAVSGGGPWFGNSMVWPSFDGGFAVSGLAGALSGSILFFLAILPLGILAGVLLWLWRKDHPPKRPLSGLIDEV